MDEKTKYSSANYSWDMLRKCQYVVEMLATHGCMVWRHDFNFKLTNVYVLSVVSPVSPPMNLFSHPARRKKQIIMNSDKRQRNNDKVNQIKIKIPSLSFNFPFPFSN